MRRIKVSAALVCEYITQAPTGKLTLLNVYAGNILVKEFPAVVPLAFYLEFPPSGSIPEQLVIEIFNGKKRVAKAEAQTDPKATDVGVVPLPQMPFTFPGDATITIVGSGEGFSRTTLLKKTVRQGPVIE